MEREAKKIGNGRKGTATASVSEQARQSVDYQIVTKVEEIKKDLECITHSGRVCYVRLDGTHGQYDHNHFLEHAKLLVSPMVFNLYIH